ncbi:MAG: MFS transporter [Hyphomicrobiaceae bacterium]|nr:MFS transporter [Hyphomicrobiaceae bacterium]
MNQGSLAAGLAARLPFYYGWIILACVCCASISRTGPAVATLSLFVGPMTAEFGWSRTALSGAVSLGGILAALTSPMIGTFLDRQGPRVILMAAVVTTGATILMLAGVQTLVGFYLLFCIARMNFAGPFDLGIFGAVSNWFVVRRPLATSIATLANMVGLTIMPLVAWWAMAQGGWRSGWLAIGITVLAVGFLPTWLLMVRRPEDLGLSPDGGAATAFNARAPGSPTAQSEEPAFTRREALATRAFWMLSLYTLLIYPVQAGMSLHQAAHITELGLGQAVAVTSVTVFSAASAIAGLAFGVVLRRIGVRVGLALSAALLVASALLMSRATAAAEAIVAATLFGVGMGGLHIGLPVAWADYFGRKSYGAIRGVALAIQVTAQAAGPLLSGALRDASGDYALSLLVFATLSGLAALAALLVRAPTAPGHRPA